MIRGFYSSAAGMLGLLEQQDAISNNLANCNTPGYKRSSVSFSAFEPELEKAGRARSGSETPSKYARCVIPVPFARQDPSQGLLEDASSPTTLAIEGPGAFVIRTAQGERLTRSGNFTLNSSGQLVTTDGQPVMGQNGPIRISGTSFSVDADGNVQSNGTVVDRLRIEVPGQGRAAPGAVGGRVIQGRLENSNVSAVREMVSMIAALRAYEANQRTIQALDQTLDKVINLVGKTA